MNRQTIKDLSHTGSGGLKGLEARRRAGKQGGLWSAKERHNAALGASRGITGASYDLVQCPSCLRQYERGRYRVGEGRLCLACSCIYLQPHPGLPAEKGTAEDINKAVAKMEAEVLLHGRRRGDSVSR